MHTILSYIGAHPVAIGFYIAAYAFVATLINKYLWPKPAAPPASVWLVRLHFAFVDWPSSLPPPNAEGKGLSFKIKDTTITPPFLSWSQLLTGPPPEAITKRQVIVPPPLPPAPRGDETPIGPRKDKGAADEDWLHYLAAIVFAVMVCALICIGCTSYMLPANPTPAMVTQIECQSLNSKVVGYTAAGFVTGALSGGSGLTALLVDRGVPQYVTGAVSIALTGLGALWSYLATDAARRYAQTCTSNVGGIAVGPLIVAPLRPVLRPTPSPTP